MPFTPYGLGSLASMIPFGCENHHLHHPNHVWGSHMRNQDFGQSLTPEDLLSMGGLGPLVSMAKHIRPFRQMAVVTQNHANSTIKREKDKFQINLDVQHFAPEEISVKTVDGYIVVTGVHEEKQDEHGYVSRQFVRRYALPEGVAPDAVESRLSSDGVLTVTAPRKLPEAAQGERVVPIAQTGPVRKEVKEPGQVNGEMM